MSNAKFATAINCMDGRTQTPVNEWIRNKYGVDYVDTITEPGPNKILAENKDKSALESIKNRINISVNKHKSTTIAIVGHHDCAGNPTDQETQKKHTLEAIKTVSSWGFNVNVIGLWVNENWEVSEVK
jgi:carbonic anhydrase